MQILETVWTVLHFIRSERKSEQETINGAFTLPDSDSDNITVHSYGTHIKIGNKIRIGSVSVNRPFKLSVARR